MGMDLKRWIKRDDLKDALRETLDKPEMEAAIEVIEQDAKPSFTVKGQSSDHVTNAALAHAFQAGVQYAVDKLRALPRMHAVERKPEEASWSYKREQVEAEEKESKSKS